MRPSRALLVSLALVATLLASASTAAPAREAAMTPARHRVTGVSVVVAGDIACEPGNKPGRDSCQQAATAKLVTKIDPKRVIALGDNQYEDGTLAAYRGSYAASWGAFKKRTRAIPGNHEYHTRDAAGFYRYFRLTSPGYRAITIGTWRVYLLNSMCGEIDCTAERDWFKADLAANPTACTAMALHFPRYSSGSEHGSNSSMSPFWTIAYNHGVDVAFAGHDHDYERFAPMDGKGHQVADGITSFVVGTGGKSLYSLGTRVSGSKYFKADKFGVLALTFGSGEYAWKFRAIDGTVRDAGSRSCH